MLTRILVIAGQAAVKQLVHLDVHVYSELRRRARIHQQNEESTKNKRHLDRSSASRARASVRSEAEEVAEDDELVGAVADDEEAEFVRKVSTFFFFFFFFFHLFHRMNLLLVALTTAIVKKMMTDALVCYSCVKTRSSLVTTASFHC